MWEIFSKLDFLGKIGILIGLAYVIVTLWLIIYQITNFTKLGELKLICVLAILSLTQVLATNFFSHPTDETIKTIVTASDSIYTVVEFIILQLVYCRIIEIQAIRALLAVTIPTSLLTLIIAATNNFIYLGQHFGELTLITSIIILALSFFGYYHILNSGSIKNLVSSYQFWFITAVFFLFSISLPLYFFRDLLISKKSTDRNLLVIGVFGILYYTIFFMLLNIASRCKVKSQK